MTDSPTMAEIVRQLQEARGFKYRSKDYGRTIEYGENAAHPFYAELFSYAFPKAKAYNDIMIATNGQPEGVEYASKDGERYAFVAPDAAVEGKFRVQYFDKDGFFSHATKDTREEALEEMIGDGYRTEARGVLDRFAATRAFQRGNDVSFLIGKLNVGDIDHAEFVRRRDALYADEETA